MVIIVDYFSNSKYAKKKRDFLSEKRESGMRLKKREFTPESGSVDTYAIMDPDVSLRLALSS